MTKFKRWSGDVSSAATIEDIREAIKAAKDQPVDMRPRGPVFVVSREEYDFVLKEMAEVQNDQT